VYTLTAADASGKTVTATTRLAVSTPAASETPSPSPTTTPSSGSALPVVNYFTSSPPFIITGATTTLKWNVSNAATVTIDHGIGNVGLVGTAIASPTATTDYTLTATNSTGWSSVTLTIVVGYTPLPADKPDLVVQDLWQSGSTIHYRISNEGPATAGSSPSVLAIDGIVKAYDSVGPLNAGATSNESFTYTYYCSGSSDAI